MSFRPYILRVELFAEQRNRFSRLDWSELAEFTFTVKRFSRISRNLFLQFSNFQTHFFYRVIKRKKEWSFVPLGYIYKHTTIILLPFFLNRIILDAGYFMPTRTFYNNIGTILLYAVFVSISTLFYWFCKNNRVYIYIYILYNLLLFSCRVPYSMRSL